MSNTATKITNSDRQPTDNQSVGKKRSISMKNPNIKFQKKAYIHLVETYCRYGYDISDMMHPTYKRISVRKCIDICNELFIEHNYTSGIIESEEDYKTFLSIDCTFYSSYGLEDRDQDSFLKEVRSNVKKTN